MIFRVESIEGAPRITLIPADLEALGLHSGDTVVVTAAEPESGERQIVMQTMRQSSRLFETHLPSTKTAISSWRSDSIYVSEGG